MVKLFTFRLELFDKRGRSGVLLKSGSLFRQGTEEDFPEPESDTVFHSITAGKSKDKVNTLNKLAKARKTRKSPGTLSLNKFGPGKLWFEKVWAQFFLSISSLNWMILRN